MVIDSNTRHVQLDIRDPDFFNNPYPYYQALQTRCPIFYWETYRLWSFVAHEDVTAILRDRRFGRQISHKLTRAERGLPPIAPRVAPFYEVDALSMLELEPPSHTRLRSLVQKAFMRRQIGRLQPRIEALAHTLIDQFADAAEVDILPAFATPIPVIVIAEMLGVPTEMCDQLLAWSHAMVRMYEMDRSAEVEQAAVAATVAFADYLRSLVAERRRRPQDDLISQLIAVEQAGDKLTEDELISTCILLLNAGHEATVNVVGNGLHALLRNPAQLDRWRRNPDLTASAVEELLRFDTPLHQFNRYVLEDLEYKGQFFKQGTQVALILGAANWDQSVFDAPERLDIGRKHNPHVSLGGGIHYCLGAPLARLELQTSLPILMNRLPNMTLSADVLVGRLYKNTYHFHALESLKIIPT